MSAYESAPVAANYQGAGDIANQAGLHNHSSTAGRRYDRPLTLIVSDHRHVLCQIDVTAERGVNGWHFTGFVPEAVLT